MFRSMGWRRFAFCAVCFCYAFLFCNVAVAQENPANEGGNSAETTPLWTDTTIPRSAPARTKALPASYRAVALNTDLLHEQLANAPLEFTTGARLIDTTLVLPMPNGTLHEFRVVESPMMADGLAEKFPTFKTYSGVSISNPQVRTRFGWTAVGFSAMVVAEHNGAIAFIEPYAYGDTVHHISYMDSDMPREEGEWPNENDYIELAERGAETVSDTNDARRAPVGARVKVLRTAVAMVGEITVNHGGTITNGLAAVVNLVNYSNTIMEHDLAIRLELVADNDKIIFTDPATDPYVDHSFGENATALTDNIGWDNFDVGHYLSGCCGGVAYVGAVCNGAKAGGKSSPGWRVFTHEVGHQFWMGHTQNSPICGGGGAEIGSGVTIMSYGNTGVCGSDNIGGVLPMYHVSSYDQGVHIVHNRGESCGYWLETGNTIPEVTHAYPDEITIPLNTPFILEGAATDADGDSVTYTWDQFDYGPAGHHNQPVGNAPLFRTFGPVNEPYRYFPQISDIVNNTQTKGELLPFYARNLHMRLMVHDGRGGVNHADVDLRVTDEAGPFRVLGPNSAEIGWTIDEPQAIQWDVANTFGAPVNCERVNIQLSTDGGYTYPVELASKIINDGLHNLNAPNHVTNQARVRVMCADSIFFDISDANFSISAPCAADTVVTSAADNTSGSLRDIITNACSGATITFAPSLNGQTLRLDSTIAISKSLTIDGEDRAIVISGDSDGNGSRDVGLFAVDSGLGVTIRNLALMDGAAANGSAVDASSGAVLTLEGCTIANHTNSGRGAIHLRGSAHATVRGCAFYDNSAFAGASINVQGSVDVRESSFYTNTADWGAAIQLDPNTTATVVNSTFSHNLARAGGTSLNMDGGTNVTVLNSTFYKNRANGRWGGNGASLRNNGAASLSVTNSIMTGTLNGNECAGSIHSNVNNLIHDASCGGGTITGTVTLTPLQDNGGQTWTHGVLAGSVTMDAGDGAACPAGDQRGAQRADGLCDVGAFEAGAAVNTPPTIGGAPITSVDQDSGYSFVPFSGDGEGDILTFAIENRPNWATFNTTTGALSGTPTGFDIGTIYNIVIHVSDGIATTALAPFDLTVNDLNDSPVIAGEPTLHAVVGHRYHFTPTATDLDYDPIAFTISNKPSWATFDTATGYLSGTPTAAGVDSNIVISAVDDQGGSGSLPAFDITTHEFACTDVWVLHGRSSGDDSLPDAVSRVCDGGLIRFVAELDGQTIRLDSTITIDKNVTIDGQGVSVSISGDSDGNGSNDVGIFIVNSGTRVTIRNLALLNGSATNGSAVRAAGGATLTLEDCTIAHHTNSARGAVQIVGSGHGIVRNCAFHSNTASVGAAIDIHGSLEVSQSSFYSNTASWGAAIQLNGATSHIVNSTFSNNHGTQGGAALNMDGGAHTTVLNSTFYKNRAGGYHGASMRNNGAASLSVTNSILTGTLGGTECTGGGIHNNVNNLIHDASCGGGTITGTVSFSPLQDNGGATWTHAVYTGSVTIDAGDAATCPVIDQRGYGRNGTCDLGAYEYNGAGNSAPTISGAPATSIAQNSSYSFTPTAADADGHALTFSVTGLPEWMAFDAATGQISGIPLNRHIGPSQPIYLTVQDVSGARATLAPFTIEVADINDAPLTGLGYGLAFDGVDDYASIALDGASVFGSNQDFTIELWVKTDQTRNDPAILSNKNWNSGSNWGFVIAQTNSTWKFNIDGDGFSRQDLNNLGVINDGAWHHLVVVVDRDTEIIVYQNGAEVGRQAVSTVGSIDAGLPLNIAQDGTGSYADWFAGELGEVRIWHAARTPSEIATAYQHLGGDEADLAGYWDLDEQLGTRIYDATTNDNHGAIHGGTWTLIPTELAFTAPENGTLTAQLQGYDADGDALIFANPNRAYGNLSITDAATGAFTYTPTPNVDSVTDLYHFTLSDGIATTEPMTAEIEIENTNYAPVAGFGRNLQFNGTNMYASIPNSPAWQFGADKDFTIELWVKTTATQDDPAILSDKNWSRSRHGGFAIAQTGSTWRFNIATGTSASRRNLNDLGVINDGQWHHLAVTADRDGDIVAYQNGVEVGRIAANGLGDVNKDFPLNIGQDGTGNYAHWFAGQIDEIRIWHVARTPGDIAATMHHPLAGNETGLVGYWPLDEDSGRRIHDRSAHQNHGAVVNMPRAQRQPTHISYLYELLSSQRRFELPAYELNVNDVVTYSLVSGVRTDDVWLVDVNQGLVEIRPNLPANYQIAYTVADAYTATAPMTITLLIKNEPVPLSIALASQASMTDKFALAWIIASMFLLFTGILLRCKKHAQLGRGCVLPNSVGCP